MSAAAIPRYHAPAMPKPDFITAQFLVNVVVLLVMVHVILGFVAYAIYLERKISAYIQDRVGPNRVGFDFGLPFLQKLFKGFGFWGLGQPLADGLKFILKEDYTPPRADKALFTLAPMTIVVPALIGFAVIPWGGMVNVPDFTIPLLHWHIDAQRVSVAGAVVNVGVVYLLAVAALGVYGVTLGGWASNNKYSFLGGLRSTAQMLAYEIPLGMSLLSVLLIYATLSPEQIIRYQVDHGWMILAQPLAGVIFFISILAEANRAPFDNAEAEQELVGGYHTEYSSMRFALFFLAEYGHMVTSSAFFALLFLGGYHMPLIVHGHPLSPDNMTLFAALLKFGCYFTKVVLLVCFMIVVRWTLPRMRYDQVMMMGWNVMIPCSLIVLVVTSIMVYLGMTGTIELLLANVVMLLGLLVVTPMMPRSRVNRPIAMYGSRFRPMPGEVVRTGPSDPMALEDRPMQGSLPV
jgi:NADH-quinone oxidoreductase subunit H